MQKLKTILFSLAVICGVFVVSKATHAASPHIFYTDIIAGPNSGWENGDGCYLSIFGNNFGSDINNIFITIGGGQVARKIYLGPSFGRPDVQQLSVQLGSSNSSGDIVVSVPGQGSAVAPEQFMVRSGNAYYVSTSGNDSTGAVNDITKPYRTANKVMGLDSFNAGDFMVIRGGTYDLSSGNENIYPGTNSWINQGRGYPLRSNPLSGTSETDAVAIMGYPGETPLISWGTITGSTAGIKNISRGLSYYTIANLSFDLADSSGESFQLGFYTPATYYDSYHRIVNVKTEGATGVPISFSRVENSKIYGISVGNQSDNISPTTGMHMVYMSHSYTNVDFAYNYIHDNTYGRAAVQLAGDEALIKALSSVDIDTNSITLEAVHNWPANTAVQFYVIGTGVIPNPLLTWTTYYVGNPNGATLQLLDAPNGNVIDLTTTGSNYKNGSTSQVTLFPAQNPSVSLDTTYCWGNNSNVKIHHNLFKNLPAQGLLLNLGSAGPIYIYDNIFDNNNVKEGYSSISLRGAWRNAGEYYVYNNTFVNCKGDNVIEVGNFNYPTWPSSMNIKNNIFQSTVAVPYHNGTTGQATISSSYPIDQYNIWQTPDGTSSTGGGNTNPKYSLWSGIGDSMLSTSSDTIFNNFNGGGYTLKSTSPAKGAGTNLSSLFITDYIGEQRVTPWDIGAYQYTEGGDATTPGAPGGLSVR